MSLVHGDARSAGVLKISAERLDGFKAALDMVDVLKLCNIKMAYSDGKLTYLGYSLPGYGADAAASIIMKFTYDISGNMTSGLWADASLNFDKVWDNRAGYTYTETGA